MRWDDKSKGITMRSQIIVGAALLCAILLSSSALAQVPVGDYGDAPDGTDAYPGIYGKFPTKYDSSSKGGARALNVGEETIGPSVSKERGAEDTGDPDGTINLVDSDRDDRIYVQFDSNRQSARLILDVSISSSAPQTTRYLNALIDFDSNGSWAPEDGEWAVENMPLDVAPGNRQNIKTNWFEWGDMSTQTSWIRVVLSRSEIADPNWRGGGEIEYGEIEDFIYSLPAETVEEERREPPKNITRKKTCGNDRVDSGEQCDGLDDLACPGKCAPDCSCPKQGKEPVGKPGPRKGPCTTPVLYHALVINAGDNPRRRQGVDAADSISGTFYDQGYDSATYLAPYWDKEVGDSQFGGYSSLSGIEAAIADLAENTKCVDRVVLYIVGHGLSAGSTKYGKKWTDGGIILNGRKGAKEILTPEKLDELLSKYFPPCPNEDCKTEQRSCHVSVVIESCHSGNFMAALSKHGRTVAASCSKDEVAFFGEDEGGKSFSGDYTVGYVKDMATPSTADTNKDGYVSVKEAHDSAEAKLSIAKMNKKSQTPLFFSDECECLPLTCGPKCGDNKKDSTEDCDYTADPTGCDPGFVCTSDCTCIASPDPVQEDGPDGLFWGDEYEYPQNSCKDGRFDYFSDCQGACDDPCVLTESRDCWICPQAQDGGCPEDRYAVEECEDRLREYQICRYDDKSGCWYLQSICNRGEFVSSDCDYECEEGEYCVLFDGDGPCYACSDNPGDSDDLEPTCYVRGMYDSETSCSKTCSNDCAFSEQYSCWYCLQLTCGQGLYDSSNCDLACGDLSCSPYGETGCYYCRMPECPDLIISYRKTSVHKSVSTSCRGEACQSTCTLSATVDLTVRNIGSAAADSSSARVEISPQVGSKLAFMSQMMPGDTRTSTLEFSKSQIVSGRQEACGQILWWADTYTTLAEADYDDSISECDEDNNVNSGQTA